MRRMVAHACNSSTQEEEGQVRCLCVQSQPDLLSSSLTKAIP